MQHDRAAEVPEGAGDVGICVPAVDHDRFSELLRDRKVRLVGDSALVTGRAAIEAEINGQPRSLRLVFLNAWTKTPKGWKFIAWQSTPQPTT